MSHLQIIIIVLVVLIVCSVIIFPIINNFQFKKLMPQQQIRVIMKQANKLIFFKNVTYGNKGCLFYVKNKRKIIAFKWVLLNGSMVCTDINPLDNWDYPEEQEPLTPEEKIQAIEELENFNKHKQVKFVLQ